MAKPATQHTRFVIQDTGSGFDPEPSTCLDSGFHRNDNHWRIVLPGKELMLTVNV